MSIKYRAEIDGLRAIAVISVVFYHAELTFGGIDYFKGGFIGVDIFFVISGYLIASILLKDLAADRFSFLNFYERRARRILPALFTVMLVSIPFAWALMLPEALQEYAGSVLSSIAFGSNFWFWAEDGYWEELSALKPFLHTWSLSVEEQFYVFFPVLLICLWRFGGKHMLPIFVLLAFASLLLAQIYTDQYSSFTFYLLPARAWELLVGVILAKIEFDKGGFEHRRLGWLMSTSGLILIVLSIVLFNEETPHPSIFTAIPVLGTAVIIMFASRRDFTTLALSSKGLTGIGKISYGFYLWHFPVFAFARISESSPTDLDKYGWILLALALSTATYYLIEQPFRRKLSRKSAIGGILAAGLLIAGVQLNIFMKEGHPQRLPQILSDDFNQKPWQDMKDAEGRYCYGDYGKSDFCNFSVAGNSKQVLLIGDSTVESISSDLTPLLLKRGFNVVTMNSSTCMYLPSFYSVENGSAREIPNEPCDVDFQAQRREKIKEFPGSTIILGGAINRYITNKAFLPKSGELSITEGYKLAINELLESGYTVVQLAPFPQFKHNPSQLLKNAKPIGNSPSELSTFYRHISSYDIGWHTKANLNAYNTFSEIRHEKFFVLRPDLIFCDTFLEDACVSNDGNRLFFVDHVHPAHAGAKLISKYIVDEISNITP